MEEVGCNLDIVERVIGRDEVRILRTFSGSVIRWFIATIPIGRQIIVYIVRNVSKE